MHRFFFFKKKKNADACHDDNNMNKTLKAVFLLEIPTIFFFNNRKGEKGTVKL